MFFERDLFYLFKMSFPNAENVFVLDPQSLMLTNYKESNFKIVKNRADIDVLKSFNKKYHLINISGANTFNFPLDFDLVEGILSFNGFAETSMDYYHTEMYYTKDSFNAINWILSEKYKSIDFLLSMESYENVIDIGNAIDVFPSSIKFLRVLIGDLKGATDGKIQILKKESAAFEGINLKEFDSFSINLYKANRNDIISFRLRKKNKLRAIFKIPTTEKAIRTLDNEKEIIEKAKQFTYSHLEFPSIQKTGNNFRIDFSKDVKKTNYNKLIKSLDNNISKTIKELSLSSLSTTSVLDVLKNEEILKTLNFIKLKISNKSYPAGLAVVNYLKVFKELTSIFNNLDSNIKLPSSIFNNYLIPEFIGYNGDKIYFLNWENAEPNYPLLFDLFEYVFRHVETFANAEINVLINNLEAIRENPELKELYQKVQINFELHLYLFILVRMTKEMAQLLFRKAIQPEANMKVYLWNEFFIHHRIYLNKLNA